MVVFYLRTVRKVMQRVPHITAALSPLYCFLLSYLSQLMNLITGFLFLRFSEVKSKIASKYDLFT